MLKKDTKIGIAWGGGITVVAGGSGHSVSVRGENAGDGGKHLIGGST
jgi:hypothetical protein